MQMVWGSIPSIGVGTKSIRKELKFTFRASYGTVSYSLG